MFLIGAGPHSGPIAGATGEAVRIKKADYPGTNRAMWSTSHFGMRLLNYKDANCYSVVSPALLWLEFSIALLCVNVTTNLAEMVIGSTGFCCWVSCKNTEAQITPCLRHPIHLPHDLLPALPGQWCDPNALIFHHREVASPIRPAAYRRDCGACHILR